MSSTSLLMCDTLSLLSQLLQGQDVCFFCAFRREFEFQGPIQFRLQRRLYRASTSSKRPAAAAAARIEEDDDVSTAPAREILGWKCSCNHINQPRRTECTLCLAKRPRKPELVYKDLNAVSPPPPPSPLSRAATPNASPQGGHNGSMNPGSISAILSRAQFGTQDRWRNRTQPDYQAGTKARNRLLEGATDTRNAGDATSQHWGASQPARPNLGYVSANNQHSPRTSSEDDYFRRRAALEARGLQNHDQYPKGHQKPAMQEARDDLTKRRSGSSLQPVQIRKFLSRDSLANNGMDDLRRASAPRGKLGTVLGQTVQPPWAQSPSRVDTVLGGAPTEPQAWKPIEGGLSMRSPREASTLRKPHGRDMSINQIWRPLVSQQAVDPRGSAERGLPKTAADFPEPIAIEQEGEIGLETQLVDEPKADWDRRRSVGGKESDRRARLYELEEEENLMQVSRTAELPMKRKSGGSRGSSLAFDFDPDLAEDFLGDRKRRRGKGDNQAGAAPQESARPEIVLPEFISVEKLAQGLKIRLPEFLDKLEEEGFEGARYDHVLDSSTSAMFAEIYGLEPVIKKIDDSGDIFPRPPAEDPSVLPPRPPIVTIMGHVDHGKTTILDYFRKANVVASEHGGITQHIGAFSVVMPGSKRNITFLDTPGHAAFLEMRRRGAVVTDIVILVVAADDSVKAQTIEAIKHARDAGVQLIVAINKVDKPEANVAKVKLDLIQHDIYVEDHGGEYQAIPVSGKTGRGMDDLEEAILTLADVADFRAETDGPAEGWIIESRVGVTGRVATVLVRRGTLRTGDFIIAGTTWARVRTLRNDAGELIKEATPGTPVQIDGWRGDDPEAGLEVLQAANEQRAKEALAVRKEREEIVRELENMATINTSRAEEAAAREKVIAWEKEQGYHSMAYKRRPKDNEGWIEKDSTGPQLVHFVVKADVAGSTEALVAAISTIGNNEIRANIIHSGTGALTESDIKMLAATGEVAYAISFNQAIDGEVRQLAAAARIQVLDHNIIYKVTDDVTEKVGAELPPIVTQRVLGEAEIGDVFEIKVKKGSVKIAGCRVTNGTIRRSEKIRVMRRGEVVYTG